MANVNEEIGGIKPLTPAAFLILKEKDEWGGSRQFNVRLDHFFRIASWLKRPLDEEELTLLIYKDGPADRCAATEDVFQPYVAVQISNDFEGWPAPDGERLTPENLAKICAYWPDRHPLAHQHIRYGHHLISGREILPFSGTLWYVTAKKNVLPNFRTPLGIARREAAKEKERAGLLPSLPKDDARQLLSNLQALAEERRRVTELKIKEFFGNRRSS